MSTEPDEMIGLVVEAGDANLTKSSIKRLRQLNAMAQDREQGEKTIGRFERILLNLPEADAKKLLDALDFLMEFDKKLDESSAELKPRFRRSGLLSICHPLEVVINDVVMFKIKDVESLQADILHDVWEDDNEGKGYRFWDNKDVTAYDEIKSRFGIGVAERVNGLTKFKNIETGKVDDIKTYDILILYAHQYPDILFTKLSDRLHNWKTIGKMSPQKKAESIKETREFFWRIADALGREDVKALFREHIDKALVEISEEPHTVRVECASIMNAPGYDDRAKGFLGRLVKEVKVV